MADAAPPYVAASEQAEATLKLAEATRTRLDALERVLACLSDHGGLESLAASPAATGTVTTTTTTAAVAAATPSSTTAATNGTTPAPPATPAAPTPGTRATPGSGVATPFTPAVSATRLSSMAGRGAGSTATTTTTPAPARAAPHKRSRCSAYRTEVIVTTIFALACAGAAYLCVYVRDIDGDISIRIDDIRPPLYAIVSALMGAFVVHLLWLLSGRASRGTGGDAEGTSGDHGPIRRPLDPRTPLTGASPGYASVGGSGGGRQLTLQDWMDAVSLQQQQQQQPGVGTPGGVGTLANNGNTVATPARQLQMGDNDAAAGAGGGAGGGAGAVEGSVPSPSPFAQVDKLLLEAKHKDAAAELAAMQADRGDAAEWLWRQAKSLYGIASESDQSSPEHKRYMLEAADMARKAVAVEETCVKAHQWLAIILSAVGDFSSTKVKLKNAHLFKEHTLRAIELAPDDTTLHHMMGRWCYEVANVSWTTRMAAKAFGSVPDATHDDALHHFEESRRLKADWIMNLYWVAKALIKVRRKDEARSRLQQALALPVVTAEDRTSVEKVKALLETL